MSPPPTWLRRGDRADPTPGAVCPFCGEGYAEPRQHCDACGGGPVAAVDDQAVYERILPMCGPDCEVRGRATTWMHTPGPTHDRDSVGRTGRPAIAGIDGLGRRVDRALDDAVDRGAALVEAFVDEAAAAGRALLTRARRSGLLAIA